MADDKTRRRRALALRILAPVVLLIMVLYVLVFADHPKHWQVLLAWVVLVLAVLNFGLLALLQVLTKRMQDEQLRHVRTDQPTEAGQRSEAGQRPEPGQPTEVGRRSEAAQGEHSPADRDRS